MSSAERIPVAILIQFSAPGAQFDEVFVTSLNSEERSRLAVMLADEGFNPAAAILAGGVPAKAVEQEIRDRIKMHRRAGHMQVAASRGE
jgi:hypothetical protein